MFELKYIFKLKFLKGNFNLKPDLLLFFIIPLLAYIFINGGTAKYSQFSSMINILGWLLISNFLFYSNEDKYIKKEFKKLGISHIKYYMWNFIYYFIILLSLILFIEVIFILIFKNDTFILFQIEKNYFVSFTISLLLFILIKEFRLTFKEKNVFLILNIVCQMIFQNLDSILGYKYWILLLCTILTFFITHIINKYIRIKSTYDPNFLYYTLMNFKDEKNEKLRSEFFYKIIEIIYLSLTILTFINIIDMTQIITLILILLSYAFSILLLRLTTACDCTSYKIVSTLPYYNNMYIYKIEIIRNYILFVCVSSTIVSLNLSIEFLIIWMITNELCLIFNYLILDSIKNINPFSLKSRNYETKHNMLCIFLDIISLLLIIVIKNKIILLSIFLLLSPLAIGVIYKLRRINCINVKRQIKSYDCGLASLYNLLNFYGVKINYKEELKGHHRAFSFLDLINIAEKYTIKCKGYRVDDYKQLIDVGYPFIAQMNTKFGNHFVLVYFCKQNYCYVYNPSRVNLKYISEREFKDKFNGNILKVV